VRTCTAPPCTDPDAHCEYQTGLCANTGEVAYDHAIVQQAASLVRRLPAVKTSGFYGDYSTVGGLLPRAPVFWAHLSFRPVLDGTTGARARAGIQ
jgi:hypothetical protein